MKMKNKYNHYKRKQKQRNKEESWLLDLFMDSYRLVLNLIFKNQH